MSIRIRRGRPEDASALARNNLALARETEGRELSLARVRAGVKQALEPESGAQYYVAADGDSHELIGQLMVTREWSDWRDGEFWWIQSVYVAPAWRGRGVFRDLYGHVRHLAQTTPRVCGIRLYVEQDNNTARTIYRRLGMEETGYRLLELEFEQE
ncbi:MAG TPA: GNAT family N-acetyltransferase [Gammaproteobacteria bacterium]|nr:GNAT family N-acetyltransferase [Gammaproteobacteria bacterium]